MKIAQNIKTIGRYAAVGASALTLLAGSAAFATHSWEGYHWARTANPFTLKLGDNVNSMWDAYLAEASSDWSVSSVLDTVIVSGTTKPSACKPRSGRVEVCNAKYGPNGWLGIARVWITGGEHIAQGIVKLNDTYFGPTNSEYNTPAWRQFVMCQEVAHAFGLDHQDGAFDNANLGSCMDYTNDPDGGAGGFASDDPSNEHPNAHDFAQLELVYAHLDGFTTLSASVPSGSNGQGARAEVADGGNASEWGKAVRHDKRGQPSLYKRDLGNGEQVFTFVTWAQ